jgi:hypothetical protein
MLELLLMHIAIFLTLGQSWLASIQSSRRGRLKTAMGGSLLPRAAPLLLPRARRWEAPAAAAQLLLPRVRRLHRMTWWRCGWSAAPLLLLLFWLRWRRRWWRLLLLLHGGDRLHHSLHQLSLHGENLTERLTIVKVLVRVLLVEVIASLLTCIAAGVHHLMVAKRLSEN